MERHGWRILFHPELVRQLSKLKGVRERARRKDPHGFASNANVKVLQAVNRAMLEAIPQDPSRAEYRQEKTLGKGYQHWRRAKIGRRFRLFFRYNSKARVIVYAWMNDERTLRSAKSKNRSVYSVRQKARAGKTTQRLGFVDRGVSAESVTGTVTAPG